MVLTFNTLEDDWVIKYNIEAASYLAQMLQIGQPNMPSVGIVSPTNGSVVYRSGYTGPGNVHVFFGHGSSVDIDRLDPQEFSNSLRKVPLINKNPLLLVSCFSGRFAYAEIVAHELGVDVFAPEGACIFSKLRYAVVNGDYVNRVSDEQDRLYNQGLSSEEIFTQLTDFVKQKNYGTVDYWFTIKDIHNDFTKMGFRKFAGQ